MVYSMSRNAFKDQRVPTPRYANRFKARRAIKNESPSDCGSTDPCQCRTNQAADRHGSGQLLACSMTGSKHGTANRRHTSMNCSSTDGDDLCGETGSRFASRSAVHILSCRSSAASLCPTPKEDSLLSVRLTSPPSQLPCAGGAAGICVRTVSSECSPYLDLSCWLCAANKSRLASQHRV